MALTDSQVRIASPNLRQEIRSRSRTPNPLDESTLQELLTKSAKARSTDDQGGAVLSLHRMNYIKIESEQGKTNWLDKIEIPLPPILNIDYTSIRK